MASKVLESYFLDHPKWAEVYADFNKLHHQPLGWFYSPESGSEPAILKTLDDPAKCDYFNASKKHKEACRKVLTRYCERAIREESGSFPQAFQCEGRRSCTAYALSHGGVPKGFIITCNPKSPVSHEAQKLFRDFVDLLTELAYRTNELHNFYETVQPRAVALSTMHSVHRLVRQSLSLDELLPRVARLAMQIVKATTCTIYLCDEKGKYLIPRITIGEQGVKKNLQKIRIGTGLEGKSADTGEFVLRKDKIAVPLIKDDVAGILVLGKKKGSVPFTHVDLEILKTMSEQAVLAIKNAELFEESEQLTEGSIQSINDMLRLNRRLTSIEMPYFKDIVRAIAKDMNLSREEKNYVEQAASLLDVGHAGVPEAILKKTGKLTKKEYEEIKKHPVIGARLLRSIHSLKPVLPIILTHHERYDGKGYPEGLKGKEIPLGGRILALVDAFSAMVSERPYRKRLKALEALREIDKESSKQFDPEVVKSFMRLAQKHKEWRKL